MITDETNEGRTLHTARSYLPVAPKLETFFPKIVRSVRILPYSVSVNNPDTDHLFQENAFYFVDTAFFTLFSFEFIEGSPVSALATPNSVVLIESTSKRWLNETSFVTVELPNDRR